MDNLLVEANMTICMLNGTASMSVMGIQEEKTDLISLKTA